MESDAPELREALEQLERALETPFIPGELSGWVVTLGTATATVGEELRRQIAEVHAPQTAEILEQDPGLAMRVEQIEAGDEKSLEMLMALQDRIARLQPRVAQLEPDEGRAEENVADLRTQGLEFVIHARSQETALGTWFAEAFTRDRGTVD